jgi:starvation-inducible DNA-binding protein
MTLLTEERSFETGIPAADRERLAEGLNKLLADTYVLYLKTHNFHWNVTGPHFHALHLAFEQQYTELALAVDEIAERIRALGFPAPGTFREFERLASIEEPHGVPTAQEMVRLLLDDQAVVGRRARILLPLAEQADDVATNDLLARRIQVHEKTAWMLRSQLA